MKPTIARTVSRLLVALALIYSLWTLSGFLFAAVLEALTEHPPSHAMVLLRDLVRYLLQIAVSCALTTEIIRNLDAGYDEERVRDCLDACKGHDTQRVRAALVACEGMSTERLRTRPRPVFEGDLYAVPEGFKARAYGSESRCVRPPDEADIALGLDIHAWLIHRSTLVLGERTVIDWALLYSQFGEGFASDEQGQHDFRLAFLRHLATLAKSMPELYYDESQSGLVFHRIPDKQGEPA